VHPKHPKKEVNEALDYADKQGLTVERTSAGHKWGRIRCSCGAFFSIWSTLQSPHDHAVKWGGGLTSISTTSRR
jgi:hypothetical protein